MEILSFRALGLYATNMASQALTTEQSNRESLRVYTRR